MFKYLIMEKPQRLLSLDVFRGITIKWNPETEMFVDDADGAATKLMHYNYRTGWKLV